MTSNWMSSFILLVIVAVALAAPPLTTTTTTTTTMAPKAGICPLTDHQVCNDHTKQLRCVCAMSSSDEPPPERSCTTIIDTQNINSFEAVSVIFNLDEAAATLDSFPEDKFRDQIASHLRLETRDILIVRVRCMDDDKKFAVQFIVVKNEDNDDDNDGIKDSEDEDDARLPFGQNHFVKASSLVSRMKVIGPMNSLAGLHVDSIQHVSELYPMEGNVDNSVLITQAAVAAIFVFLTCTAGCWLACRKRDDYEADLQKT